METPPVRLATPLLIIGLAAGFGARLVFAFTDDGLWWPDEYYQALEPAHRAVFGYGWQAWEFVDGARHWTLPGIVASWLWAADRLGLPLVPTVEVLCCLIHLGTALSVYALARALESSRFTAALASTVYSLMGLAVFIAPRTMGEGLSTLPITLAFALVLRRESRVGSMLIAGLLLSLAVGLRLQNGLFCVGALIIAWRQRPRRDALALFGTLLLGALIYGLVDLLTWGQLFHSAITYVRFNLIEGRASSYGVSPVWHYVTSFFTADGLVVVPLVLLSALVARRRPELPWMVGVFFVVHSFIPHKELRFLFPLVPLLVAHAALGLERVKPFVQRTVLGLTVISLGTLPWLTFGRLGIHDPPRETRALDLGGPYNRLLMKAGRLDDLCGLRIADFPHWRTGGYAYFHRDAPLYRAEKPGEGEGHFNYVIARRGSVAGNEVATDGEVALIRLVDVTCTPDPAYDWRLE